jgi:hypothetical protein
MASRKNMNTKFVLRGLLVALPMTVILSVVGLYLIIVRMPVAQPPDPTPPPPIILATRGEMPLGSVGLEEWVQYRGEEYVLSCSGFLIALDDGEVVGVTTAHCVSIGDPNRPLEKIALAVAGQPSFVIEFETLQGLPGQPSTEDLSLDYMLLQVDQPIDPELVLVPDPRGVPQPGERVSLFSGLGDGQGGQRVLDGTVQWASETTAWVLMDEETFHPGMMSGSPIVSQHTGQVVGMAIAVSPRDYRLFPRRYQVEVGMHPIGSIVQLAESADVFPKISEYRQ